MNHSVALKPTPRGDKPETAEAIAVRALAEYGITVTREEDAGNTWLVTGEGGQPHAVLCLYVRDGDETVIDRPLNLENDNWYAAAVDAQGTEAMLAYQPADGGLTACVRAIADWTAKERPGQLTKKATDRGGDRALLEFPGADGTVDLAAADNPTQLRWGPGDVLWGDDDTVTVLLSDLQGEPYWLELGEERAAALRQDLAGPGQDQPTDGLSTALGTQQVTDNEHSDARQ